jgi:formylglycine-generating enzyme required for sulfatase activity
MNHNTRRFVLAGLLALLALTGSADEYEIHLQQGWNLISVTRQGTTLSAIGGDAIQLPGFCSRRGSFVPIDGQEELKPGLGYWVFAARALRSPQDSNAAVGIPLIPAELMLANLSGPVPGAVAAPALNDLAWSWEKTLYRGATPATMRFGSGYSLYPDLAQAALSIGVADPAAPRPGERLELIVSGGQYLAAGGVVWIDAIATPIVANSATRVTVITPAVAGSVDIVLDAGHGLLSAPFSLTVPVATATLTAAALQADRQSLLSTLALTLDREHAAINDAHIATADAQLLALDALFDTFLAAIPSAQRDDLLLLLEAQDIHTDLASLETDIASRTLAPSQELATIQAALTRTQPNTMLHKLADLRSSQLTEMLVSGDTNALRAWLALAVLAQIAESAHALSDWIPSSITDFRVDETSCDLPTNCELRYFADFAISHNSSQRQLMADAILGTLATDLDRVITGLPADFAIARSALQLQGDAVDQIQLGLALVNEASLEQALPAELLIEDRWENVQIDLFWMEANALGYLDVVFSQAANECGTEVISFAVNAGALTVDVEALAPGFARLDASIFNADRSPVFTANADLSIDRGLPSLLTNIPGTASDFLFDAPTDDTVTAVSYSVTVQPPPPMSGACLEQGSTFRLSVDAPPGLQFTELQTQSATEGIELSQRYFLAPGSVPLINEVSHQVFAGTSTVIPLTVTGFDLGLDNFPAQVEVSSAAGTVTLPFQLPLNTAFNNAIGIDVLQTLRGTAENFIGQGLAHELLYTIENTPGVTDVVTVVTGVNGVGPDLVADPPNGTVQQLLLEVVKAPLTVSFNSDFVYDGLTVDFFLGRQFGVPLLPDEELALSVSVDPPDDILISGNTIEVGRGATPGFRDFSFHVGDTSETLTVPFEIIEDRLSLFAFDTVAYTNNSLEFAYFLDSGSFIPVEDVFVDVDPPDGISSSTDTTISIGPDAEEGLRTLGVFYEGKSAEVEFSVVKDVLSIFPGAPSLFEGSSLDFTLFFQSGKEVVSPVVTIDPPDDVTITDTQVSIAFGATPGLRAVTAVANGTTANASITVVDDTLELSADSTGAFPGSDLSFTVSRTSGNALNGQPTLAVLPADDIVVNGLVLEIADSAALGLRTVTATLGSDSVDVEIEVLGDAEYVAIDLSAGSNAATYTVTRFNTLPEPLPAIYKTSSLLLRRVSDSNFTMGSPITELGRVTNEIQHAVTFTQHHYIGVFEVTQRQWELVTGTRPSGNSPVDYETRPVDNINYNDIRGSISGSGWPASSAVDADSFVGLLQARTGLPLDLPTEAQWENACRAGTTTALNNGTNLADTQVDPNLDLLGRYANNSNGVSGPVGQFLPNAIGVYDMHGNVWEWCRDWFGSYSGAATDPVGAASGSSRVVRGGSFLLGAQYTRSANRGQLPPATKNTFFGLRLAAAGSIGLE